MQEDVQELNKVKRRSKRPHYSIDDMNMVYRLCDEKLLDKLHGVNTINNQKVFFFDRCKEIQDFLNRFNKK